MPRCARKTERIPDFQPSSSRHVVESMLLGRTDCSGSIGGRLNAGRTRAGEIPRLMRAFLELDLTGRISHGPP